MRLTFSIYVSVEREDGRGVTVCRPWQGQQITTRDALLGVSLSKLGNKMRKVANQWIEQGQAGRIAKWLYDPESQSRTLKLTLPLRDRTLRWKVHVVTLPAFDRWIAFSPSIPDAPFELDNLAELETRAVEVYTDWAQAHIAAGTDELLQGVGESGEMWIEPLEVEVETKVDIRSKSRNMLASLLGGGKSSGSEELHKVGRCLDDLVSGFRPAFGRDEIVDEIDRLLQRDDRQGVLIIGPASVGKTAILHACFRRRAERFRDRRDQKPQVWWLSPQRLISGMSYLGQWEQRWLSILRESAKRDHVLYFDDLVGLFTAGRTRDSSLSAADVLRGFLAEHRVRIVGETTAEQLAVLRRRDRELADRFHLITVPALSPADALPITLEAAFDLEVQTAKFFQPEAIPLIMQHQEMYAPDQAFPGKAIEMCKSLTKHATLVIERTAVYRLAKAQVGANLMLLLNRLGSQQQIQEMLSRELIGQPAAIQSLSRVVVRYAQHLQPPDRPLGVLLLLGPTGVGKTEAAKALTRLLYTDLTHLVRLDMNELTTPLAAEQLVGTFDQPDGRLTTAVRRQPNCVILLDEIEKAHPDVFDYLLQVLGEGRLTDARGRIADFRSSIIILTSNLGASEQNTSMGFEVSAERREQIYLKAAQRFFRPEFFNRLDEVVAFRALAPEDMEKIVAIQLNQVLSRDGIRRRHAFVNVTPSAVRHVIQSGFDSRLGARAVRRMLEREIIGPLGDCLAEIRVERPILIQITRTETQPRLQCQATPLEVVTPGAPKRIVDLDKVLEASKPIYDRLDQQLHGMIDELQRLDEQSGESNHKASYYSLREQLYRISELQKGARFFISREGEPNLSSAARAQLKPLRDPDGVASKRLIRDWHAQVDLHTELVNQQPRGMSGDFSRAELAKQLADSLTIAAAMINSALTPRHWLVGMQPLTSGTERDSALPADRVWSQETQSPTDYRSAVVAGQFIPRLMACLKRSWQYEVKPVHLQPAFFRVSGVSLIGILGPLLGTYQLDTRDTASHLLALRAIPISATTSDAEIANLLARDTLLAADGTLRTPVEHTLPTRCIRGLISERVVDWVTGASVSLGIDDWYNVERLRAQDFQWWTDCLPAPLELLQD